MRRYRKRSRTYRKTGLGVRHVSLREALYLRVEPNSNDENVSEPSVKSPTERSIDVSARDNLTEDQSKQCSVCLNNERIMLVDPCGHICLCYSCSTKIVEQKLVACPLCRTHILKTIRAYV